MKTLIIYFSKTGTTEAAAQTIAGRLEADLYEITEADTYTSDDLNWTVPTSRANQEQGDESSRPAYEGNLPDVTSYDQVIIGHPIWWGRPPRIIQTVLEDLDLTGKTVASFATSGGSTYSESQRVMNAMLDHPIKGRVLSSSTSVDNWLKDSNLSK